MDIRVTLIILVGIVITAQWLHLWVRQRGNPRLQSGPKEPQVVALGASFVTMTLLWIFGLNNAFSASEEARPAPMWALIAALVIATIGASLRIAAIERIGKGFSWGTEAPATLITDGVYRLMKHPLIVGYVFEAWALGFCRPSTMFCHILFLLACATLGFSAEFQMRKEENVLAKRFSDEWPRYAKSKIL